MSQFYLIAPSGYCINQEAAYRGVQRLQEAGHQVAHQQVIPRRALRFAGTENERLGDINQLAALDGKTVSCWRYAAATARLAYCRTLTGRR